MTSSLWIRCIRCTNPRTRKWGSGYGNMRPIRHCNSCGLVFDRWSHSTIQDYGPWLLAVNGHRLIAEMEDEN